jgi:hypothetical protein
MNPKQIENKFYAAKNDEVMAWKHEPNGTWSAVLINDRTGKVIRTVKKFRMKSEVIAFVNDWWKKNHSRPGKKDKMAVKDRFYFGKGRKERFGASDKVDSLIATAYRALKNGDKAAARRLIASAEALIQSDSSVPDYIVNELKDLKKSLRF